MAKAAQFASWFFAACAANSLISWLAVLSPEGSSLAKFFYLVVVGSCLSGIILDDGIQPITGLPPHTYDAAIGIVFLSSLFGAALIWLTK